MPLMCEAHNPKPNATSTGGTPKFLANSIIFKGFDGVFFQEISWELADFSLLVSVTCFHKTMFSYPTFYSPVFSFPPALLPYLSVS
jgi:hypothetical protein